MKTMKKLFAGLLVLCMVLTLPNMAALAADGTYSSPYEAVVDETYTTVLNETTGYDVYYTYTTPETETGWGKMSFTVESVTEGVEYAVYIISSDYSVYEVLDSTSNELVTDVPSGMELSINPYSPNGEDVTISWNVSYEECAVPGSKENPDVISTLKGWRGYGGAYYPEVTVGDENGYSYAYTMESDGTLQIYLDDWSCYPSVEEGLVADVVITNKTANASAKLSESTATKDNYGTVVDIVELAASEGDELLIQVIAKEAPGYDIAAVGWNVSLIGTEGSKAAPISLEEKLELDEDYNFIIPSKEAPLKITVPAGKTYYVQGPYIFADMYTTVMGDNLKLAVMQANGAMVEAEVVEGNSASVVTSAVMTLQGNVMFTIENTGTTDVEYSVYFDSVEGTYYAPATIEDTDTHEFVAGEDTYYYTYTATEDGYIKVQVSSTTEWFFYVENTATEERTENHYSNSAENAVVSEEYIAVSKDDVILIAVMPFDATTGNTVAGTLTTTVEYVTPDVATVEGTIGDIAAASKGDVILVELLDKDGNATTVIPAEIIGAAKDAEVVLGVVGDFYVWAIDGSKVTSAKALDLAVTITTDVVPEALIKEVAGELNAIVINIAHDGELGLEAELGIYYGEECWDAYVNLFYYNEDGELEFLEAVTVDEDGYAVFTLNHASDYVLVDGDDLTPDTPDTPDNGTEEDTVPDNGDVSMTLVYVIVLMGAALVVAGFVSKKKFA